MFIDTHAHYDNEQFDVDRESLLQEVLEHTSLIINPASSLLSNLKCMELANEYPQIYIALGIHPHYVGEINEETMTFIESNLKNSKVVAIGEIGLDYHYNFAKKDDQKYWLRRQIHIAKEHKKPIILHNREASEDIMNIVIEENAKEVGGVFHCFSGSYEMAVKAIENNFYISFGGPITFKNSKKAIEVIKKIPIESILVETDCPYLSPEPFRGKRNNSLMLKFIIEKISQTRDFDEGDLMAVLAENSKRLFGIG